MTHVYFFMVLHFGDEMVVSFFFLSSCKMILNDFTICFLPRDFGGIWSNLAAPKARGNGGVKTF